MVKRILILLLLIAGIVRAADKPYYQFPDATGLPDSGRVLMYDPTMSTDKSRNITGSMLRSVFKNTTTAHQLRTDNPHAVTAAQVGSPTIAAFANTTGHQNRRDNPHAVTAIQTTFAPTTTVLSTNVQSAIEEVDTGSVKLTSPAAGQTITGGPLTVETTVHNFFKTTPVDNATIGNSVYIYRNALEGLGYGRMYVNSYNDFIFNSSGNLKFDPSGTLTFNENASGDMTMFQYSTAGKNRYLYLYGYDTGVAASQYARMRITTAGDLTVDVQHGGTVFNGTVTAAKFDGLVDGGTW